MTRRPDEVTVRYEIRPVGDMKPGLIAVPSNDHERAMIAKRLRAAIGTRLQDRMFNNNTHIGHNKFAVHIDPAGIPQAAFTGSTHWTSTGIAGQTTNALLVEDKAVAKAFLAFYPGQKGGLSRYFAR